MTRRIRSIRWCVAVAALLLAVGWWLAQPGHSEERVTDEQVTVGFSKPHRIMQSQQQRLHAVLDGFLEGDPVRVTVT